MKYLKLFEAFSKHDMKNQVLIDTLLDKINKYGKDSLTWHEKDFLQNTDEYDIGTGSETIQKIANDLLKAGYVSVDYITLGENYIEIYDIKDQKFPYFLDNYLHVEYTEEEDGKISLYFHPKDHGEKIDLEERAYVFDWMEENFDVNGYYIHFENDGDYEWAKG